MIDDQPSSKRENIEADHTAVAKHSLLTNLKEQVDLANFRKEYTEEKIIDADLSASEEVM